MKHFNIVIQNNKIKTHKKLYLLPTLLILVFCIHNLNATTIKVNSFAAVQNATNTAKSGDTIVVANGTYLNNTLTITKSNLTIMPTTNGAVFLNGTDAITLAGNYLTFRGFQFISGTITGNAITITGSNNTLTQLNFNGYNAGHMLMIKGQNNVVSYSNFQNKPAINMIKQGGTGDMVQIIPDSTKPGYNIIRYCTFLHMPGMGGDYGNECIRIGDGIYSLLISRTIVEYCYFEDTGLGDSEAISVKSRENVLRHNTMRNNPDAMFAFRNGDNNVAYGNFFFKSGGIRIKQANNIYCYNNYFQNTTPPIYLMYFDSVSGNNNNFIHNTFYRGEPIIIDTGINKKKNNTWANNIFYSDSATILSGTKTGQTFIGNIYQGKIGFTIASGMTKVNPLLSLNADGYYGITAGSPAINAATAGYPAIIDVANVDDDPNLLFDIQGKPRPAAVTLKDIGCTEDTTATITYKPLQLCDAGPAYLCTVTPVKYVSVQATRTAKATILVHFSVANEVGIKWYAIKQSADGIHFNTIGTVKANATTENMHSYTFMDMHAAASVAYYQIEGRGENGEILNSDIVSVIEIDGAIKSTISVYPNPITSHSFRILLNGNNAGNYKLTLINLFGQDVFHKSIAANRISSIKLPDNIANGTYFLQIINTDGAIHTEKVILQ